MHGVAWAVVSANACVAGFSVAVSFDCVLVLSLYSLTPCTFWFKESTNKEIIRAARVRAVYRSLVEHTVVLVDFNSKRIFQSSISLQWVYGFKKGW